MKKIIGIISGDPESINSEIIAKVWKKKNKFRNLNIIIFGNFLLLKKQFSKLGYKFKIKKIEKINNANFNNNLIIYDVPLKFKNPFKIKKNEKKQYIKDSFKIALNLVNKKKILGIINCSIDKRNLNSKKNFSGVTEYLARKNNVLGKEVMLIYNKTLSVSPVTTHLQLKSVAKNLSKNKIIQKIITIDSFFKKRLNIRPKIGILGLNPHNNELNKSSEEKTIIIPAINFLKKKRISVQGPISPDTAFIDYKKKGFDVLVGMYHDQVLGPFKTIFKFNAINITLGLPFVRISPDHGVGKDIIKKNRANPESLHKAINFFKKIND